MRPFSILILAMFAFLIGPGGGFAEAAPPKPTKLTLNAKAKTLTVGQKFTARVKAVKPRKATKKVKWKSSKKSVATVSGKGAIKAVGAGTATITAQSTVRARVKAKIKVTVKAKRPAIVIDPKLLGSWGLFITGAGSIDTYNANGTWTSAVIFEAPFSPYQIFSKGYYQARNGQIHYFNVTFQDRKSDDDKRSAWKPAADRNRIENYEIGTDEYGEYLMTETSPDPVTPESAKYRRSE